MVISNEPSMTLVVRERRKVRISTYGLFVKPRYETVYHNHDFGGNSSANIKKAINFAFGIPSENFEGFYYGENNNEISLSTLLAWLETNEAIRTQKLTRERLETDYGPEEFRRRVNYEVEKSVSAVMKSIENRVFAAVKAELVEKQLHA